jgi:hypothetical protein
MKVTKGDNVKTTKLTAIQHGEAMLLPVTKLPKGEVRQVTTEIIAHSETGHHHVIESPVVFQAQGEVDKEDLYIRLFEPAKLVHKKPTNRHKTLTVPTGIWKVIHKTEYNPFAGLITRVKD